MRIEKLFLPVHELGTAPPSRDAARAALGIERPRVALFFGHVRPFKALDVALRAWTSVDALLFVAGEVWWNDEQRYRDLARELGIEQKVRFDFRFIPDAEIATCFAAADCVLVPYRHEAQSGVVLTSFHFGRPVIATRVGGIPEIVTDCVEGLLVPPEDPAALASAVERFFGECDREAMERSAAAAAARYSWEEFAVRLRRLMTGSDT